MRRKAYTWDFTTLGHAGLSSQTGGRSAALSPAVANCPHSLWMKCAHRPRLRTTTV